MESKAFIAHSVDELTEQLAAHADFHPTLAIAFASIQHDLDTVRQTFATAKLPVFGASSAGEILEMGEADSVYEEDIVVMLFKVDTAAFKLAAFNGEGKPSSVLGTEAGAWAKTAFSEPALLLMASGIDTDGEAMLRGVQQQVGDIPIYGGLAGDDLQMQKTYVFDSEHLLPKGVIALVFDRQKIEVNGVASSGWQAVGNEKTITKSEGNVVFTIDGMPALDVYGDYLGVTSNQPGFTLTAEYPLQVQHEDGTTVMRASLLINTDNRSMIYAGTVPQGAKVRFCIPPGTSIIEHALEDIKKLKETNQQADALVLFSCKGRHLALGPMAEDEIKPMQQLWNAPLIGFYTYGEIGQSLTGKMDFHNNTCVLVTLQEKSNVQ